MDEAYYCAYLRPRLLIFSVIIILTGALGIADQKLSFLSTGLSVLLTSVLPFAAVVWFCICLSKIQKELW